MHLCPVPQKAFLWNMQTLTSQSHCHLSWYVTSAPLEMEAPTPCSEVKDKHYFFFEVCELEPSKMFWATQWVTTETTLSLLSFLFVGITETGLEGAELLQLPFDHHCNVSDRDKHIQLRFINKIYTGVNYSKERLHLTMQQFMDLRK